MTSTVLAATTSILRAVVLSARGRVREVVIVFVDEPGDGVAVADRSKGVPIAGTGRPAAVEDVFGADVFGRPVGGTRFFDTLGALAAG
jgi:hypothetical protein